MNSASQNSATPVVCHSLPENLPLFDAVATPLEAVAAQINQAHADAQAYASKAVERALVAGEVAK